MLGAIEQLLVETIRPALPPEAHLLAGPALDAAKQPRLQILARSLKRRALPAGEAARDPGQAWLSRRDQLMPDAPPPSGDGRDYTIPQAALDTLEEVQAPPGRLAVRGDDYMVDGRRLRFQTAPTGVVEVVTRGGPAQGWRERARATARLDLVALAPDAASADALLEAGLSATLAGLVGRDVLTLAWTAKPQFRLRLLSPEIGLLGLGRGWQDVGAARWARASAAIRLRGDLETMVSISATPPAGVIGAIEAQVSVLPGDHSSKVVIARR